MRAKDKAEYVEKLTRKLAAPHAHASHTPGPWYPNRAPELRHHGLLNVVNDKVGPIAYCDGDANARLIAAAPELLKALKDLVESIEAEEDFSFEHGMDCDGGEQCAFCSAKNAIAQVEEDYISGSQPEGGAE